MTLREMGFGRWIIALATASLLAGCSVGGADPAAAQRQRIDAAGPSTEADVDDGAAGDADDAAVADADDGAKDDVDDAAKDDVDDGSVP